MGTPIFKIVEYVDWSNPSATYAGNGYGNANPTPTQTDLSGYYTKIELQTANQASVNWENIINVPSLGTDYVYEMSLEEDSGDIVHLVGDIDTPGNSMYYGTDETGVKGYWELPQPVGGGVTLNGNTPRTLVTVTGTDAIQGETNLTFDGTDVNLTGGGNFYAGDFGLMISDRRLKTKIEPYIPEPLDVNYVQFEFKDRPGEIRFGVIAQQVMKKHPELVKERADGKLAVSHSGLFIREIAYLLDKVNYLEQKIEELESKLTK